MRFPGNTHRRSAGEGALPSQRQVKWAQLRVGLTVIIAAIVLAVLIFLMNQAGGFFSSKITVRSYFDNAAGLRVGAPVALQGVTIGNVSGIHVVPDHGNTPVEVLMKISRDRAKDVPQKSTVTMNTLGVLGEVFIDIDRRTATGNPPIQDGQELPARPQPDLQDIVRSSQGTLQNIDVLVRRVDRIVSFVESGEGSIGKLIYDEGLYKRLNSTLNEFQGIVNQVNAGKGSVGKLVYSDELYNKANASVDKLNNIIDQVNSGQGTIGKLITDPSLYNNANQTIAKANRLMDDVNAGKGALGIVAKDPVFAQKLDNTMNKLSRLVDRLDAGEGTVGLALRDKSVYVNTDQMLVETRTLLKAIRENPKKYLTIHFKLF